MKNPPIEWAALSSRGLLAATQGVVGDLAAETGAAGVECPVEQHRRGALAAQLTHEPPEEGSRPGPDAHVGVRVLAGIGERLVVHPHQDNVPRRLALPSQIVETPVEERPLQGVDGRAEEGPQPESPERLLVTEARGGRNPGADDGSHRAAEHGGLEEAEAEHAQEAAPGGRKSW